MIKQLLQIPLLFGIENDVESLRRLSFRKTLLHLHVGGHISFNLSLPKVEGWGS